MPVKPGRSSRCARDDGLSARSVGRLPRRAERSRDAGASLGLECTAEQNGGHAVRAIGRQRDVMSFDPENATKIDGERNSMNFGICRCWTKPWRSLAPSRPRGDRRASPRRCRRRSPIVRCRLPRIDGFTGTLHWLTQRQLSGLTHLERCCRRATGRGAVVASCP